MDLSKAIAYNGITLQPPTPQASGAPLSGYQVTRCHSTVGATYYFDKRAIHDGMDANDVYLNGRLLNIQASVFGSTKGDFWDKLAAFTQAFDPVIAYNNASASLGFAGMTFYRPTADISSWPTSTYPNGIPLQMNVRPVAIADFSIEVAKTGGVSGKGLSMPVTVALVAKDPRIYLQTSTSIAITGSNQTATSRGKHPSMPIITFTMSSAGNSAMTFTVNGLAVVLDMSTTSTGTYTVTFDTRQITDGNGASADRLFTSDSQGFGQIDPGNTTFKGQNLVGVSAATLTYTEAWT